MWTSRVLALCFLSLVFPSLGSRVKVLKSDTFDEVTKEGFWLVEFYAPWCGHCKKLNPILDEISVESVEKGMRIGKVDATSEKKIADRFGVEGYPTLKFRVRESDEWRTYEGMRKGVSLLAFADRMLENALPLIESEDDLNALVEKSNDLGNGIIYLFGSDSDSSSSWKQQALKTAQSVQHKIVSGILFDTASLSWSGVNAQGKSNDSPFPSEPFIASLEKGEMPRFIPTSVLNPSREKAETGLGKDVEDWILNNNAPVFSEFTASNFRKLGKLGKLLVIAIIDPSNETTAGFIDGVQYVARSIISEKSIKATGGDVVENDANPNRPDISDQYVFGSLDGVHWAEFIEQFNIFNNELPRLVVLDMPKEVFFEDPSVDELDEIDTFLHEVYDGKIPAQKEGMKGSMNRFFSKITSMGWRFYLLAVPFIIALIGAFVVPTSTDKDKYQ